MVMDVENECLNIAAMCPTTKVLGPGKRFVVWVQGCCFDCYNCGSPDWKGNKEASLILPKELAQTILLTRDIEGVTISGGEPFLQAHKLLSLMRSLRSESPLSIIVYTGFTLEELKQQKKQSIDGMLSEIDVLIDGRYVDNLNDNKGWRGEINQTVHFLRGKYRECEDEFLNRNRDVELFLYKEECLIVGIKPKSFDNIII